MIIGYLCKDCLAVHDVVYHVYYRLNEPAENVSVGYFCENCGRLKVKHLQVEYHFNAIMDMENFKQVDLLKSYTSKENNDKPF